MSVQKRYYVKRLPVCHISGQDTKIFGPNVMQILGRNRELLDAVVDRLVEKKSLTKQEFFDLVELHGSLQSMPPTILDIRAAAQLQLQNIMADTVEAARSSVST